MFVNDRPSDAVFATKFGVLWIQTGKKQLLWILLFEFFMFVRKINEKQTIKISFCWLEKFQSEQAAASSNFLSVPGDLRL